MPEDKNPKGFVAVSVQFVMADFPRNLRIKLRARCVSK